MDSASIQSLGSLVCSYCAAETSSRKANPIDVLYVLSALTGDAFLREVGPQGYKSLETIDGLRYAEKDIHPLLTGGKSSLSDCPMDSPFGYMTDVLTTWKFDTQLPDIKEVVADFNTLALSSSNPSVVLHLPENMVPKIDAFVAVYELRLTVESLENQRRLVEKELNKPWWEGFVRNSLAYFSFLDNSCGPAAAKIRPYTIRMMFDTMYAFARTKPLDASTARGVATAIGNLPSRDLQ